MLILLYKYINIIIKCIDFLLCCVIIKSSRGKQTKKENREMKKEFIKNNNLTGMVRELVDGLGMNSADAIDYVYDMKTMSNEEFAKKYLK